MIKTLRFNRLLPEGEWIMSVTIADVAKCAGVSTATVSHVINNTRTVSKETSERVLETINQLGFTRNASARTLKTGKTDMIGLVVPDISNLYFATIIQQVEEILGRQGKNLIITNTKETLSIEQVQLKNLTSGIVDGLIIASAAENYAMIESCIPSRFPCVFIDRNVQGCQHDALIIASYQAMHNAVMSLIERGHRRIGYIAGVSNISTTRERLRAYCDTLQSQGLPVDEELILYGNSISARVVAAIDQLLERRCTAIVVSNNLMSVQAAYQLSARGITVGQDMDLVVYKDYEFYSTVLANCDMIVQPVMEFGNAIGDAILERIAHPEASIKERILTSVFQPKPGFSIGGPYLGSDKL